MECSCAVPMDCETGGASGVREIQHAGKDHVCAECRTLIKKGTPYFYHVVFADGTIYNSKVCPDCQSVINQFFGEGWWFEMVWDQLRDYVWGYWKDDLPSSCISQLTPVARARVCDLLQEMQEV